MKFFNIKTISAALMTSGLLLGSCNEMVDGYSTDPVNITDPTVITTDKFLSSTHMNLIGTYEADMSRLTGMWSGYFSGEDRQYIGLSNYGVSGRDFNTEWGGVYSSVIKNATIIKARAKVDKNPILLGVAQAAEGMAAGLAADLWGDVPYSEMSQYPVITTPKYDAQADVYARVQVLLDSAIANLGADQDAIPSKLLGEVSAGDVFFAGDADAWIAVCNTLKARFYLHVKDYANAETFALAGIQDAAGNMMAPHGSSYLQNFNLYYSFTNYDRPGYMSGNAYAPQLLDATNDLSRDNAKTQEEARLNYYYIPGGEIYVAGPYELNFLSAADGWVEDSSEDGFFGTTTSFPMVTYEETNLILAEARIKQSNFAGALTALNTHRQYLAGGGPMTSYYYSSGDYGFQYDDYVAADFAPGTGMENADGISANDALLREIIEERYVTFNGQLEGYNDIRRTGNLLGVPVKSGNATIPLRLLYPQSEINTNPNVPSTGVSLFIATPVNSTPY